VGSWLLPAHLRPHIVTFYNFARAIDDIADTPTLSADEKLERLSGFADVVKTGTLTAGYEKAAAMAQSLAETGITVQHCLDLVTAFCQDARQDSSRGRYADWEALMAYCRLSAAPVGRYLIDLHGGEMNGYGPSDALCCALQVINHVQDCVDDYRTLGRVYLPSDWMEAEGTQISMLERGATSPELGRVLKRVLDATDELLVTSQELPGKIRNRRLAMEAAVIQRIAEALVAKLRREDPLAGRVSLGRFRYGLCGLLGVLNSVKTGHRG
jgi:squalene synthase HpnC